MTRISSEVFRQVDDLEQTKFIIFPVIHFRFEGSKIRSLCFLTEEAKFSYKKNRDTVRSGNSASDGGIGEYFSRNSGIPTIDVRSHRQNSRYALVIVPPGNF